MTVNNEQERMWKEGVTTKYKVLSWYLPDGIEQNHKNPVTVVSVPNEIKIGHFPNSSQKCYHMNKVAHF
jgi:hypothetical protein